MTSKEKAEELFNKYCIYLRAGLLYDDEARQDAKQCALIAVDEIINSSPSLPILGDSGSYGEDIELSKIYWQEVKQEIEKIII
jgi:hypothetical protein